MNTKTLEKIADEIKREIKKIRKKQGSYKNLGSDILYGYENGLSWALSSIQEQLGESSI